MKLVKFPIRGIPTTGKHASPWHEALLEYKDVVTSGFAVAGILALFRYISGGALEEVVKFEAGLTKHALQLPAFLVNIAIFALGLSLSVSGPWGPILRKHVIRPILGFLLHNFGIAAGFIFVVWLTDPLSRTLADGPRNAGTVAYLEILLLFFGYAFAIGMYTCKHGTAWLVRSLELEDMGPRLLALVRYLPLPMGAWFMWLAYKDIIRLAAKSTVGH